jgi:hypothetical protein
MVATCECHNITVTSSAGRFFFLIVAWAPRHAFLRETEAERRRCVDEIRAALLRGAAEQPDVVVLMRETEMDEAVELMVRSFCGTATSAGERASATSCWGWRSRAGTT